MEHMNKNGIARLSFGAILAKYWLLLLTLLLGIVFGLFENAFFQATNLLNILSSACLTGIAGIGVTCVMATGEMDFSAGTSLTMGAVLNALFISKGLISNYFLSILITFICLAAYGLLNAFLNIKVGIPSFIATMGSSYAVKGIIKGLTDGATIQYVSSIYPGYTLLGQGYLFGIVPIPLIMLVLVGIIMLIFTERTRGGKYLYAVGVNPETCKFIGINANAQKVKAFVLCACLCGFSGIIQGSMVNGGSPTLGDSMMTSAITVLMLGATFLKIGVFNVPGTIVGAILIAIISNGLTMIGAASCVKDFVQGGILFIAVATVALIRKRTGNAGA